MWTSEVSAQLDRLLIGRDKDGDLTLGLTNNVESELRTRLSGALLKIELGSLKGKRINKGQQQQQQNELFSISQVIVICESDLSCYRWVMVA